MDSKKTQHLLKKLIVQLLGTLICQMAVAADAAEQFPSSRPVQAWVQPELPPPELGSFMDEDECIEDSLSPTFATLPEDNIRLIASPSMSRQSTGLPSTKATPKKAEGPAALLSEAPLALKKEGPLNWQSADATPVQPSPSLPPVRGAASTWEIAPSDISLNAVIARWAVMAGWQLVWELPVDYTVQSRATIAGTFEEAVEAVAKSMVSAEIPMKAIFYRQNKVVRIVAKGAQ